MAHTEVVNALREDFLARTAFPRDEDCGRDQGIALRRLDRLLGHGAGAQDVREGF